MSTPAPHPLDQGLPPRWASAWGEDTYGPFVAFEFSEVEHVFRWVPPGTFWMGSPESEQGRFSDEGPRHLVTLTQGLWLGETPVTQALWLGLMGENPSRFQDPDRPVEQVSWEDCQAFLTKLNGEVPELAARLPAEAEWERACRAGMETSTYAGNLVIEGECNAPLLHEIAWYGGNSGVDFDLPGQGRGSADWPEKQFTHTEAGTRRVKGKRPNAWGLYDMLGNVWEWCEDRWQDHYDLDHAINPRGPGVGSERVARGGSWVPAARHVRAAARRRLSPMYRSYGLGFRLAHGQGRPRG